MQTRRNATKAKRRAVSTESIERLTVLWVVSSLILLLLIAFLTLFGSGHLRAQSASITRQTEAIVALQTRLEQAEAQVRQLQQQLGSQDRSAGPRRDAEHDASGPARASDSPPQQPAGQELSEPDVRRRLAQLLKLDRDTGRHVIDDQPAAARLLQEVDATENVDAWSGRTWARLALTAHLTGREESAERCALRAANAGTIPVQFYEIRTREALADGRNAEALVFATRLAEADDAPGAAPVLLATAALRNRRLAAADAALANPMRIERLSIDDRVRLAEALAMLEHWPQFAATVDSLVDPPDPMQPIVNKLRAILAIQRGEYVAATAILEHLLNSNPDDYELRTWRGVALLEAGQYAAARSALAHAENAPARPEAWYWRGRLEIAAGRPDAAVAALETAVAADRRFVAAWEALASLALNANELERAVEYLGHALEVNPRRTSARFLLAIVHAKAERREECAAALKAAIELDPRVLETARQTSEITKLFTSA